MCFYAGRIERRFVSAMSCLLRFYTWARCRTREKRKQWINWCVRSRRRITDVTNCAIFYAVWVIDSLAFFFSIFLRYLRIVCLFLIANAYVTRINDDIYPVQLVNIPSVRIWLVDNYIRQVSLVDESLLIFLNARLIVDVNHLINEIVHRQRDRVKCIIYWCPLVHEICLWTDGSTERKKIEEEEWSKPHTTKMTDRTSSKFDDDDVDDDDLLAACADDAIPKEADPVIPPGRSQISTEWRDRSFS